MNLKFIINDYMIVWNILFTKSITDKMRSTKRKAWNTYKDEYNKTYYDKKSILQDPKNFIPNNDIVYNEIIENDDFKILKKQADKQRVDLMKLWDKNIKKINYLSKKIIRKNFRDYLCFVVNNEFDLREVEVLDEEGRIVIGKKYKSENLFLIDLIHEIAKKEIIIKEEDNLGIKDAIIELAILNEFGTMLNNSSCYNLGDSELSYLKRQIYPYWLMFLGIPKEDMVKYMMRDKIAFEVDGYAYEKELINMNIEEFIEFIIRNKRYIVRFNRLDTAEG